MNTDNGNSPRRVGAEIFRRGMTCYFDVDGVTIGVWASAWSGREVVCVDDRVVSRKFSFRFVTRHPFTWNGRRYEVRFIIDSMLRGEMRCELYRDGTLLDTDEFVIGTGRQSGWKIAFWGLIGAVLGYTVANLLMG